MSDKTFREDNYLPCRRYDGHEIDGDGFSSFTDPENNEFYFSYLEDGKVILRSEGYANAPGRDNGIASVKKNMGDDSRYTARMLPDGRWVLSLKAGNHQEIARSCTVGSEAEALAYLPSARAKAREAARLAAEAAQAAALKLAATPQANESDRRDDDYLTCKNYEGHDRVKEHADFSAFEHAGEYFFAMHDADGKVRLRSERYKSIAARDNGIQSVIKNRAIKERFSIDEKRGIFYVVLKAGNHQEIARSCPYTSHADADAFINPPVVVAAAPKPERRDDDYLTCKNYEGHDRVKAHADFSAFEHAGEYFFAMHDADGKVRLRSERYKSIAARDNGIQSVIKNRAIKERFSIDEKRGIFYVVLKAGNHQEIARSCPYTSNADADAFINPPVVVAAAPKPERQDDDYLACKMYDGHERTKDNPDFSTFSHDGEFYFAMLDQDGKVRLRSEGYKSEAARNNGIASVTKNREIKERFSIEQKMKYHFVVLKAGNHQEIGRSCPYASHADADAFINPPVVVAAAPKPQRQDDDYLACKMYDGHERTKDNPDFSTFSHDGEFYFAMLDQDEKVRLRSEGYKSEAARNNGIASVTKNREIKERFSIEQKMKYHFVVLKAGNHQEIGRSCPYASHADADAFINPPVIVAAAPKPQRKDDDYLACKMYDGHERTKDNPDFSTFSHEGEFFFAMLDEDGKVRLRSERYQSAKARDNGIQSVIKNRTIEKRWSIDEKMGYHFSVLKAGNHQEIGRSCPQKEKPALGMWWLVAPAVAMAAVPKPQRKDDDYLACKMYDGHERTKDNPDFSTFSHDGEFFFAMLDEDGKVRLRSERYQSAKARDNGIQSVIKNRAIEKRWSIDEKMGYHFSVLKAGNNQEIGRSCPQKEKPAAGMWWLAAPAVAMAAAAIPPKAEIVEPVAVEKEKEDDYLACKEYANRNVNDKKNNVALFKHKKNGQFYFALYDKEGKVRLRSEGFKSAKKRDQELRGVLKYKDNKDMYSRIEKKGHYIDVLKDKTGREVGRSCLKKIVAAAPVVAAAPIAKKVIATAAVAAAAGAAAANTPAPKKVAAVASAKAAAPAAAAGSGFNWKWLLPLLLLIPLFFMWKTCNKAAVVPPVVPPVVAEKAAPAAPVEKEVPPPVVPAAPTCDCSAQTHPVFNLPSGEPTKSSTKLGIAPEFGRSHGLSPAEFYQKLNRRYKKSRTDKRFLDGIFQAMGYDSFKDANADLFSDVTITPGINANLGTRKPDNRHATVYRKLDLKGEDLEAFKIKAKNACDMHFMKTCGNHMFYCPK